MPSSLLAERNSQPLGKCKRGAGAPIPPFREMCQTCLFITGADRALPLRLQPYKCCLYGGCLFGRVIYLFCHASAKADNGVITPPLLGEGGLSSPKLQKGRWVKLLSAFLALCHACRQKPNMSGRWGPVFRSLEAPWSSDGRSRSPESSRQVKGQAGATGTQGCRGHFREKNNNLNNSR